MSKFEFFNDTKKDVIIHIATESQGIEYDDSNIVPLTTRMFNLPNGTYSSAKLWDHGEFFVLLVRAVKDE